MLSGVGGGIGESVLLSVVGEEGIKGYAERYESVGGRGLTVRLFVRYVRRGEGQGMAEGPVLNLLKKNIQLIGPLQVPLQSVSLLP